MSVSTARSYWATSATVPLVPTIIVRRAVLPSDVAIKTHYCGICHSDLRHIRAEWKREDYPMVPGHELVGIVEAVGESVTKFKVGDRVGVGCMVNSCLQCEFCSLGEEPFCSNRTLTYGSPDTLGNLPLIEHTHTTSTNDQTHCQ